MYQHQRVSVVIPALNEAQSIGLVIADLRALKNQQGHEIIDEIVVCDNGSNDHTAAIAKTAGAVVVFEAKPGYGRACLKALDSKQKSDIILFMDADHAFYAHQGLALIEAVANGSDLAIGSRVLGNREVGSLTPAQLVGNQLASSLIRLLWQRKVTDLGPFRAISQWALTQINMQDQTFGWTIEMQIKAIQNNMTICEVAVDTRCRIGVSKISGTFKGSIGAGIGILSMIAKLWWQQRKNLDLISSRSGVMK